MFIGKFFIGNVYRNYYYFENGREYTKPQNRIYNFKLMKHCFRWVSLHNCNLYNVYVYIYRLNRLLFLSYTRRPYYIYPCVLGPSTRSYVLSIAFLLFFPHHHYNYYYYYCVYPYYSPKN